MANLLKESNNILSKSLSVINETEPIQDDPIQFIMKSLASIDSRLKHIEKFESRLSDIENMVMKINTIDKRTGKLETSVSLLKTEMKTNEKQLEALDSNMIGMGNVFDGLKEDTSKSIKNVHRKLNETIDDFGDDFRSMRSEQDKLKEDMLKLQTRSMRQNLLFFGIPESEGENCETIIKSFIADKMNIEGNIELDRAHRCGQLRTIDNDEGANDEGEVRPRPIVARFSSFKDKERVKRQAPVTLKGTDFAAYEQFPPEIEARRKLLYPKFREARRNKQKAKLVVDRLYINKTEWKPTATSNNDDQPSGSSNGRRSQRFNSGGAQRGNRKSPSHQERKRARPGSNSDHAQ